MLITMSFRQIEIINSILMLVTNVFITVAIEALISYLIFNIRNAYDQLIILIINICTNLVINLLVIAFKVYVTSNIQSVYIFIGIIEIINVFIEMLLFKKNILYSKNSLILSLTLNASSFLVGLFIWEIIFILFSHYFWLMPQ